MIIINKEKTQPFSFSSKTKTKNLNTQQPPLSITSKSQKQQNATNDVANVLQLAQQIVQKPEALQLLEILKTIGTPKS